MSANGRAKVSALPPNSNSDLPVCLSVACPLTGRCVEDLDIRCEHLAVRHTCFGVAVQDFIYMLCCMY